MSRCFPEPAPLMAVYRLHRGVDARDVAHAHDGALTNGGAAFQCHVVSGTSPFAPADVEMLASTAAAVLRRAVPELASELDRRGWTLPSAIDRVYDAARARDALGWAPRHGWREVLAELDRESPEVLPVTAWSAAAVTDPTAEKRATCLADGAATNARSIAATLR